MIIELNQQTLVQSVALSELTALIEQIELIEWIELLEVLELIELTASTQFFELIASKLNRSA